MEIKDILLITENSKGTEKNLIMTFEDFKQFIFVEKFLKKDELADVMVELGRTVGNDKEWSEIYFTANKTVSARYCYDAEQMTRFLQGYYNSSEQSWTFDSDRSSSICIKRLKGVGGGTNGRRKLGAYQFKHRKHRLGRDRLYIILMAEIIE